MRKLCTEFVRLDDFGVQPWPPTDETVPICRREKLTTAMFISPRSNSSSHI